MSLTVTPAQLAQRAGLYHQLSQLVAAGIGLPQAIRIQQRSPPSRSFREPLSRIMERLAQGSTFTEACVSAGNWLPEFDASLIEAGEKSGRLPECFKLLADHYTERASLLRQSISSLTYPAFLFHFAILIGPINEFFLPDGSVLSYLAKTLGIILPLYVVIGLLIYAAQGRHGERWRALIEQLLHRIPFCGSARRNLSIARLSSALEALLAAGVSIINAWELSSSASGSPALKRAVHRWRPAIEDGLTPADMLDRTPEFPELFANMYRTGEISGTLEDTLKRMRVFYQEEGSRQLRALADWTPKIIYFAIVIMIAWRVVGFYLGYFEQINKAMGQ